MTTEEKARAYDEALERAREFQKSKDGLCVLTAESIFPELAESEDEKALRIIRKRMCYDPVPISDEDRRIVENWLEKQKEQKPLKVGENAYFDPNTDMWFIKKEQKPAEDKELLKNILFQKKGITYDDYKCKNNPYVGLYFDELIKCLEEYDKTRSDK